MPHCLVFRKKDLYLVITQKLIFLKSGGFHLKSGRFHEIRWISCEIHPKPYKIRCFNKNSSVWGVQGGGYDPGFHVKSGGFHEIERPLARNCNPMFLIIVHLFSTRKVGGFNNRKLVLNINENKCVNRTFTTRGSMGNRSHKLRTVLTTTEPFNLAENSN